MLSKCTSLLLDSKPLQQNWLVFFFFFFFFKIKKEKALLSARVNETKLILENTFIVEPFESEGEKNQNMSEKASFVATIGLAS